MQLLCLARRFPDALFHFRDVSCPVTPCCSSRILVFQIPGILSIAGFPASQHDTAAPQHACCISGFPLRQQDVPFYLVAVPNSRNLFGAVSSSLIFALLFRYGDVGKVCVLVFRDSGARVLVAECDPFCALHSCTLQAVIVVLQVVAIEMVMSGTSLFLSIGSFNIITLVPRTC